MAAQSSKRVVTIRIVGGGGSGDSSGRETNQKSVEFDPRKILSKALDNAFPTLAKVKNSDLAQFTIKKAGAVLSSSVSYATNRYFSLKEDYLSENVYNNIKSGVTKGLGMANSLISGATAGAKTGSVFGPVGTAVGAVLGAAVGVFGYGANQYVQYQQKMSGYYQQLNATNAQTQFQAKRLGLSNEGQNTLN
jgi:hypothetical protein